MEGGRSRLPALPSASLRDELLCSGTNLSLCCESPSPCVCGQSRRSLAMRRALTPGPAHVPPAPGTAGAFPTGNFSFWLSSSLSGRGCCAGPSASPPSSRAAKGLEKLGPFCPSVPRGPGKNNLRDTGVCANRGFGRGQGSEAPSAPSSPPCLHSELGGVQPGLHPQRPGQLC